MPKLFKNKLTLRKKNRQIEMMLKNIKKKYREKKLVKLMGVKLARMSTKFPVKF